MTWIVLIAAWVVLVTIGLRVFTPWERQEHDTFTAADRCAALSVVAEQRGWSTADLAREVVAGEIEQRAVDVRMIDVSQDGDGEYWTRIRVELLSDDSAKLCGLTSWNPRDRWATHFADPPRSMLPRSVFVGRVPEAVQVELGLTFEWLIESSAWIFVTEGALYVDHPEVILDGETLDELVDAAVRHGASLDEIVATLPSALV